MILERSVNRERREYFRINDQLLLDHRLLAEDEVDALREVLGADLPHRFMTASSFAATSRQIAHSLHRIQSEMPEVARCLEAIDHKLNTLAQLFVAEEAQSTMTNAREVSLSAGGLAFRAAHPLRAGDLLEMRLVLLPTMIGILAAARVAYCERAGDTCTEFPWRIGASFEMIREADRELLVRHVMARETQQLRERRAERED